MQRVDDKSYDPLQLACSYCLWYRRLAGRTVVYPARVALFIGEMSYELRLVVVGEFKIFAFQTANWFAGLVGYQGIDLNQLCVEFNRALIGRLPVL